ncbi:MAG: hypothetical protein ABSG81_09165 [Acidimicrobiales bacterium]|jgi:hypothetical protein
MVSAVAVACVVAVAVPLAVVLSPARSHPMAGGIARQKVLAALNTTIGAGNFDAVYAEQPPSDAAGSSGGAAVGGQGVIDVDPLAMEVTSTGAELGGVTVRVDGTSVWEGAPAGLSAGEGSPGTPLASFATLVEGTLGPRQGALSMMDLASPTGYLQLDQNAVTNADEIGTGTVDGSAVTEYDVDLSPAQQANPPGATGAETTAIEDALGVLAAQGYTGSTVTIAVDGAGFIRQTVTVANFSDGATQTTQLTLSDFGCAGTVLVPGQTGATTSTAGCVSPDPSAVSNLGTSPSGSPITILPSSTTFTPDGTATASSGEVTATTAPSTYSGGAATDQSDGVSQSPDLSAGPAVSGNTGSGGDLNATGGVGATAIPHAP